jgi:hypothetical protein
MLTARTCAAGRITARGKNLKSTSRRLRRASTVTLKVELSRGGRRALHAHRRLRVKVRVTFAPKPRGKASSSAFTTVTFKR